MFKKYLRVQPPAIQLLIFLSFWSVLQLLFTAVLPLIAQRSTGLTIPDFNKFYNTQIQNYPQLMVWMQALGALVGFLLPALVFAYLAAPQPFRYLGFVKPKKNVQILWVVLLALTLLPVVSVLGSWIKQLNLGKVADEMEERRDQMIRLYLQSGSVLDLLGNVVFIALIPAICEEVFFRGVVQRFAHTWLRKTGLTIAVSAIIFAIFHASLYQLLPIMLAGAVLAWVYYITSSLWLNVLLHLIFNGLQVVLATYESTSPQLQALDKNTSATMGLFAGGLVLAAIAIVRLNRVRTPLPADWSVVYPDTDLQTNDQSPA